MARGPGRRAAVDASTFTTKIFGNISDVDIDGTVFGKDNEIWTKISSELKNKLLSQSLYSMAVNKIIQQKNASHLEDSHVTTASFNEDTFESFNDSSSADLYNQRLISFGALWKKQN